MRRDKQQAHAAASPQKTDTGKGGKSGKGTKKMAADPPASPPGRAAAGCRAAGSQVSNAAHDALEEARAMAIVNTDNDKTPPPTPPRQTERQKRSAEEQKARNEAKVVADLNAKLAASNAQLKLALEREKKRKESSSGEAVNPQTTRPRKLSNASTRKKQVPIFRFNYFSDCHFFDGLSVHRQSLILLTLKVVVPIL